jgi:acyl-CoA synthetase (AMP-forming)/AMP-acid ligase II
MTEKLPVPSFDRIDQYVRWYAGVAPEMPAWIDGDLVTTRAQSADRVDALARSLLVAGVSPGQRVAVFGRPGATFIELFLAIGSVGAIYVGLNPLYTANELRPLLQDATPVLVFDLVTKDEHATPSLTQAIDGLIPSTQLVLDVQISGFLANGRDIGADTLTQVREAVAANAVALLVYTSGTTGSPKGAQLTHRGLTFIAPVTNDPAHFGVVGQGRTLCNLPINHVGCVVDLCCNSIATGVTLVFQPEFDPDAMLTAIERYRLTLVGGVPVMFLLMSRSPKFRRTDYSSLQRVVLAGNAAPLTLVRELQQVMGAPVINGYGLTEAMGFSTFTELNADAETIAHTVGRFDPRVVWRISDERGALPPAGEVGEIQLSGDWLFAGYFKRESETKEAFTSDGWFRTGDLAMQRFDGNIVLTGRSKEMFKSGGYNVFPIEIERAIEGEFGVAMAVVVPVPDPMFAEVGFAYVVAKDGVPKLHLDALRESLRLRLANYKLPKHFLQVQDLPMLPIGKVDRLGLRDRARAEIAGGPPATA